MPRHVAIAEYRTIGFHGTRQTGRTHFIRNLLLRDPGAGLVIFPSRVSRDAFDHEWDRDLEGIQKPVVWSGPFYCEQGRRGLFPIFGDCNQFDTIIIDNPTRYYREYSYEKTIRALAGVGSDNVVVYLIG